MTTIDKRNMAAKEFVEEWLAKGRDFKPSDEVVEELIGAQQILKNLIPISAKGFRGVVLTAIVGKALNPYYQPMMDFYACNPRSIFEKGIFYALQEAEIPCGKSDPLNVAKNIQKLDYDWATGRRPESAARAVVDYLRLLEAAQTNQRQYENLLLLYFHELYLFGQYVKALHVPMQITDKAVPLEIGQKYARFAVECPEGGSVPQFIVGHLLNFLREHDSRFSVVEGHEESVFGTNTTSRKPADVWEILENGTTGALYEITVKRIDRKRLDDCVDTLAAQGLEDPVITFICRLPQDVEVLGIDHPFLIYRGFRFQFLDISQFIHVSYALLGEDQRIRFSAILNAFVGDINRDIGTKDYWNKYLC